MSGTKKLRISHRCPVMSALATAARNNGTLKQHGSGERTVSGLARAAASRAAALQARVIIEQANLFCAYMTLQTVGTGVVFWRPFEPDVLSTKRIGGATQTPGSQSAKLTSALYTELLSKAALRSE